MHMAEQEKILRLQAGEKIGKKHIAVKRQTYVTYPQHWHNYFEIEIVVSGSGIHYFNGTAYPIQKGDAYLLTPVDFHEIQASSAMELMNVSFDEVWLSENMRTMLYTADFAKRRRLDEDTYTRLVMAVELLRRECASDSLCVSQLLDYLLSHFVVQDTKPNRSTTNEEQLTGIQKAVAYIELHFREKITLKHLASICGYNPTYFSQLFRKVTGETYIERLTALRIRYAKELLASGVSVADACFESGFGSLSNFLTTFKTSCGMPPREYRRQSKKC